MSGTPPVKRLRSWGHSDVEQTTTGYNLSDAALREVMQVSFGEDNKMPEQLTWGYMKEWAKDNKVPDGAIMSDYESGDDATDLSFAPAEHNDPPVFAITFGEQE